MTCRAGIGVVMGLAALSTLSGAGRAEPTGNSAGRSAVADSSSAIRVVELFTSQGCPKCPPADRLITDLAREPRTIALSYAVNTWDFAGWHDTLAEPAFTKRQHAYAAARGDRRIFTPQVIVDGVDVEAGADRPAIVRDTDALVTRGTAMRVPLDLSETGGKLHIGIGGTGANEGPVSVLILRVKRRKTVSIDRGANSGRSVTYTNVVRALQKIGEWSGKPRSFDLIELKADDEGYVVLLQAGTQEMPGAILAAAQSGL